MNSIIDVFASRRIDGANALLAEVFAAYKVRLADCPIGRREASQNRLSELSCCHAVLVQDHRALHRSIAHITQNLGPMAIGVIAVAIPTVQHDHYAFVLQVGGLPGLDSDVGYSCISRDEDAIGASEASGGSPTLIRQWPQCAAVFSPISLDDANNTTLRWRIAIFVQAPALCWWFCQICILHFLDGHNVTVNGSIECLSARYFQLLTTACNGSKGTGVHVHAQNSLLHLAGLQGSFNLAGLHMCREESLTIIGWPLLLAPAAASFHDLVILGVHGELLTGFWELGAHLLHVVFSLQHWQSLSDCSCLALLVICKQVHLWSR
mmetsp:Transcript_35375/g.82718  ORF Transcript_35375/g.82718 Transcript_35375/m.82718 type:complete len:322 (+) Transcript_35375:1506-2471(+)